MKLVWWALISRSPYGVVGWMLGGADSLSEVVLPFVLFVTVIAAEVGNREHGYQREKELL